MVAQQSRALLTLVIAVAAACMVHVGSAAGQTDADGDGVVDRLDLCPGTMAGVVVNDDGCSVDQLCPCPARNHGTHVSCVARHARAFVRAGLLPKGNIGTVVRAAAHNPCTAVQPTRTPKPRPTSTPIPPTVPTATKTRTPFRP